LLVSVLAVAVRVEAIDQKVRVLRGRAGVAIVAVMAVIASVIAVTGVEAGRPVDRSDSLATQSVVGQLLDRLPRGPRYRVASDGGLGYFVQYGVLRALLDHDYRAFVPPDDVQLGRYYASDDPHDSVVLVTSRVGVSLPRGSRQVAEYDQSTPAQRAELARARTTAAAALRAEPLRLTKHGEDVRRHASGLRRIGLDAVAKGTVTPDLLLDTSLDVDVFGSRYDPRQNTHLFVVGSRLVPALSAYVRARRAIGDVFVRVALITPSE
jgi:hypothetical protein